MHVTTLDRMGQIGHAPELIYSNAYASGVKVDMQTALLLLVMPLSLDSSVANRLLTRTYVILRRNYMILLVLPVITQTANHLPKLMQHYSLCNTSVTRQQCCYQDSHIGRL